MKKRYVAILIMLLIIIGAALLDKKQVDKIEVGAIRTKSDPQFSWNYKPTMREDEFPQTIVSVTAAYKEGTQDVKEIATVDGSCNDYVSPR